jgi:hypothetical protein
MLLRIPVRPDQGFRPDPIKDFGPTRSRISG